MNAGSFDLTGKVALVTGGNGGIGLGIAEALAGAGAEVCVWGTNPEKNRAAEAALRAAGSARAAALECDVSDPAQVERGFAETLERFGRVDSCFANAGIERMRATFLDISIEDWRAVMAVNIDGAFYTFRNAFAHMKERAEAGDPGGRLIGTASIAAVSGAPGHAHYAATKGGLISLILALSVAGGRYGVTANAILPGWIETGMTTDAFTNEKFVKSVLPRVPSRRWGGPADFGGAAVYLASDASAYHNGDTLVIDGGYLAF
ncbi:MAG: SDR family NAD(P)-dependent oxidoreductase [Alphaproteobacteria bacterium]